MKRSKELLEAARQVAFFAGATPENLSRLRAAVSEVDYQDREVDDEEEEDEDA